MIGGLFKSSRFAIFAATSMMVGGLAVSPASAADFGGDCCADLEERVAVLEATTARKGNKKVSLTVSGWVNQALLIWDDGINSDAYVVSDNGTTLGTRISFAGDARINSDWSAGYKITIQPQNAEALLGVNQLDDDGGLINGVGLLESFMWIKSEQLGKLSWGQQSQATDNIAIVDHSGTLFSSIPPVFRGNAFFLRGAGGTGFSGGAGAAAVGDNVAFNAANLTPPAPPAPGAGAPGLSWASFLQCHGIGGVGIGADCNGVLTNSVRYDTPTFAGFTLSASWGEDDFWDVGLRYNGEFNGFKVGFAVGYSENDEVNDVSYLQIGASIMHVPSGLFVSGEWGQEDVDTIGSTNASTIANFTDDPDNFYVKAGIKRRFNSLGATAIYGEYAQYNDQYTVALAGAGVTGSEVTRYGVTLHQWIDAAALQLYAKWKHLELDVDGGPSGLQDVEDLDQFILGGVIFF